MALWWVEVPVTRGKVPVDIRLITFHVILFTLD